MEQVITRMAPSPTGKLHLGTAYATLWPFLFARHHQGKFILRIEDTDADRSTKEYAEDILDGLKWLDYDWDEGPFYQMERLAIYQKYCDRLVSEGKAYPCFCTKEVLETERQQQAEAKQPIIYSGTCRNLSAEEVETKKSQGVSFVIRFKMPEERGMIDFEDLIHGAISFDSKLLGDFVISRATGLPLYNFVVVVDDVDMKVSHVIRGDDHISNTPKQVVLYEALDAELPKFAHYPMILNQDRIGKLSKRTGSTPVEFYKHEGYLPEAFMNYLCSLGWTHPEGKEIYSMDEAIKLFDIKDMNASAAAWNQQKLDWINGEYIRALSDEELTVRLQEYLVDHPSKDKLVPLVPLVKERIKKLSDFVPLANFLLEGSEYDMKVFDQIKIADQGEVLDKVIGKLEEMPKPWNAKVFEETFRSLADELQIKSADMFQLIRVAFSGQLVTPPMFESMEFVGEDETIKRVKSAVEFLKNA